MAAYYPPGAGLADAAKTAFGPDEIAAVAGSGQSGPAAADPGTVPREQMQGNPGGTAQSAGIPFTSNPGVDARIGDRIRRASLGAGLTAVANNWNKPALAAFAGGAGAALQGTGQAEQQQDKRQSDNLNALIHAYQVGDMAEYHKRYIALMDQARNVTPLALADKRADAMTDTANIRASAPSRQTTGMGNASDVGNLIEGQLQRAISSGQIDAADKPAADKFRQDRYQQYGIQPGPNGGLQWMQQLRPNGAGAAQAASPAAPTQESQSAYPRNNPYRFRGASVDEHVREFLQLKPGDYFFDNNGNPAQISQTDLDRVAGASK